MPFIIIYNEPQKQIMPSGLNFEIEFCISINVNTKINEKHFDPLPPDIFAKLSQITAICIFVCLRGTSRVEFEGYYKIKLEFLMKTF